MLIAPINAASLNPQPAPAPAAAADAAPFNPRLAESAPAISKSVLTTDFHATLGQTSAQSKALRAKNDEFSARVSKGGVSLDEQLAFTRQQQGSYLDLQLRAQNASLGAELVSKIVEHATSSTRNVLQTQT